MRRAGTSLFLILLLIAATRLLLGAFAGIIPDEAYYWTWSLQPDWCYWDQPAGIAWAHILWGAIFGSSLLSLRGLAVFCSLLAGLLAYGLLRKTVGEKSAFWGTLSLQILPLFAAGSVLILHDSLLLVFALAAWWALTTALQDDRPQFWTLVGLAMAAAMYAKFSAAILGFGFLISTLFHPTGRKHLRTHWPYLGGMITVVLFAPVILWNIKHDWVAVQAVSKLAFDPDLAGWGRVVSALDYIAGQLGIITPVLAALGLWAGWRTVRNYKEENAPKLMILVLPALIMLVYFLFNSLRAKIQANWPALAWVVLVPLGVDFALQRIAAGKNAFRIWLKVGTGLAIAVTVIMHIQVFTPVLPLNPDMTDQFFGWERVATEVKQRSIGLDSPILMTRRYQVASELIYHLPDRPQVMTADFAHRGSQFTIWEDYANLVGRNALFVDPQSFPGKMRKHFSAVEELPPIQRLRHGRAVETLRVYYAQNFHWDGPEQSYFSDPVGHQIKKMLRRKGMASE